MADIREQQPSSSSICAYLRCTYLAAWSVSSGRTSSTLALVQMFHFEEESGYSQRQSLLLVGIRQQTWVKRRADDRQDFSAAMSIQAKLVISKHCCPPESDQPLESRPIEPVDQVFQPLEVRGALRIDLRCNN